MEIPTKTSLPILRKRVLLTTVDFDNLALLNWGPYERVKELISDKKV